MSNNEKLNIAAKDYSDKKGMGEYGLCLSAFKNGAEWQKNTMYDRDELEAILYYCIESLEERPERFCDPDKTVHDITNQFKKL